MKEHNNYSLTSFIELKMIRQSLGSSKKKKTETETETETGELKVKFTLNKNMLKNSTSYNTLRGKVKLN